MLTGVSVFNQNAKCSQNAVPLSGSGKILVKLVLCKWFDGGSEDEIRYKLKIYLHLIFKYVENFNWSTVSLSGTASVWIYFFLADSFSLFSKLLLNL